MGLVLMLVDRLLFVCLFVFTPLSGFVFDDPVNRCVLTGSRACAESLRKQRPSGAIKLA